MSGLHRAAALLVPWVFLAVFVTLVRTFLWPHIQEGRIVAMCLGAFVFIALCCFSLAAITFSRDVLTGRYPERS